MKHLVFSIIFCVIFFKILFLSAGLFARDNSKSQNLFPSSYDYKQIDINNVSAWITNYGSFFRHPTTGNSGFEWPKGGGVHAIYCAGLWVGALVEGEPRVAIAEYSYEYSPGTIDAETHLPNDPDDPRFRVYKIRYGTSNSDDYLNWPSQDGAPLDEDGNPKLIGDQTLWTVYNDADTSAHINMATLPLGIEIQQTVFGDQLQPGLPFDFLFIRWLVINKGINHLDSAYINIWSDPDLGEWLDDLVGCDSVLSLGYCYNNSDYDDEYGEHPPAVGFQILQGPLVVSAGDSGIFLGRKIPGFKNLNMTSFVWAVKWVEPYSGPNIYNLMKARWWYGQHMTYGGYGDNPNNPETNYMYSGDPESGVGWLDTGGSDRRMLVSTGPIDLVPGDSNEVVAAAIIARGSSNLNSVTELKRIASILKPAYDRDIYKELRSYNEEKLSEPLIGLKLFQNYPNPFNSQTTISYQLPINRVVKLKIFNLLGERVATLVNERQEPDVYTYTWDASGLASGVYFASLKVAQYQLTKKLLLIK